MAVSLARTAARVLIGGLGLCAMIAMASAQEAAAPPGTPAEQGAPDATGADDVKQIKLTDDQVTRFIAAQNDLASIASKIQAAGDKPDPALQTELEGIATKHGFKNFAELDDVAANISIVMAGLDATTGNFVDPVDALKKERDDVQKDASIPEADKKQLLDELNEAISTTPKLQYKENVELVKAHRAEIEKALQ
ncbi:hypothetical protein [Hyphomicrobium sp.]|uniref:hypothetical protein n=1 Tax=Hyphomicrobium sp. TaxID=82 RepID=UPI002D76F05C|nr:hypothetical protein [Hyphomicrobium sp.]HET6390548.1 hypothetical protein [Hyphomicrobium sp.]